MSLFHRFRPSGKLSLILGLMICVTVGLLGFAQTGTTVTILNDHPDPSHVGEDYDVDFQVVPDSVTGDSVDGTITVDDGEGNTCSRTITGGHTSGWQWWCRLPSISAGDKTLTATFVPADPTKFTGSSDTESHTVLPGTNVVVFCADTPLIVNTTATGTVTVTGVPDDLVSPPTGTVHLSHTGNGTLSPSTYTLQASDGGEFEFTYTPADADDSPHVIAASYDGDSNYGPGDDTFDQAIVKRAVNMKFSLMPSTAYVGQEVTITVHVEDDTTEGITSVPTGDVTLTVDDGSGTFDHADGVYTLNGNGDCTAVYTSGPLFDDGTNDYTDPVKTITATYVESSVHTGKSASQQLTVELRPTETTVRCVDEDDNEDAMLVNETGTCTVTVKDASGVAIPSGWPDGPVGVVKITSSLETAGRGDIFPAEITYPVVAPSSGESEISFDYGCTSLDKDADYDTIGGIYTAVGGIYEDSAGGYAQAIYRRPTETTITLTATDDGYDAEVTVVEQSGLAGAVSAPHGDILVKSDDDGDGVLEETTKCSANFYNVIPCSFSGSTDAIIVNVGVFYEPDDGVHLKSAGSDYVTREDAPNLPSGGSAGSIPPDGAINIDAITLGLNSGVLAANTLALIFDAAALVADATPDPVVGVGVGIIVVAVTGVTIPTSDIAATIIGAARIALQTYTLIATTDLDGDGLPGVIELVTHTDDDKFDTDGDGLGDGYEVTVAGGYYGPYKASNAYSFGDTACPNPNIEDSDQDGIIDGDEGFYNTSICDPDTDDDGLTDYQEVTTWSLGDVRLHLDPLAQDTDGDGLSDYIEYYVQHSPCPFGNEPDSDGDGLIDGYEDKNLDGCWGDHDPAVAPGNPGYCIGGITVGGSTTQATKTIGWWETNLCDPDTDGDGLSDGEEEGMFATGEVTPKGVSATVGAEGANLGVTVPALDIDMDNDGLTDYEEVNTYQTDPMDADSDNDTISDGDEVATWDSVIAGRLGKTASSDSRDHANPLLDDTDGDGLTDNLEIEYGCNCDGTGQDGYVNDDDSDDDGLQDGKEYELFGGGTDVAAGNGNDGELHDDTTCCLCDPDSDGDGLSDGEEVHIGTDPLDWDSDDDGLSDREELQIYFTDPNNPDTDGDGAAGILPTRPAAITLDGFSGDYSNITLGSDGEEALSRTGVPPFENLADQSDPLQKDTDGDGLQDDVEFTPGCPYVNDADSDDDGLQDGTEDSNHNGVIENSIGDSVLEGNGETAYCDPDTDDDGLTDGEETSQLGGLPVSTSGFTAVTPEGVSTGVGSPGPALDPTVPALDDDSDNDGLSDYEEVNITHTDPLDADSDNDTISDANELICTGGTWPRRTFDQESDPLDIDTDDDGLTDNIEYDGTGLGITRVTGGTRDLDCPYVNDDDSDDDGLQDGVEDTNHDGTWSGITIGLSDTQSVKSGASWETDLCNPDTDGDGLLDGEEVSLIGGVPVLGRPAAWPSAQPVPGFNTVTPEGVSTSVGQHGPDLTVTVPALDDDSDNDGLSDYEEVNITGTDPLDADSDNDTISDANELICTGGTWPQRTFDQESDPLDIDTDDDGLTDNIEYDGTGLGITRVTGGTRDLDCPYVNDDDSDDDGLQDGVEDANHDGTWGVGGVHAPVGSFSTQAATNSDGYYETDLCNPDTDGDGLMDGEEVSQLGGGPILGRPTTWPANQPSPGFNTVSYEAVSITLPQGTNAVPSGYTHTPAPSPGTGNSLIGPYTFTPTAGTSTVVTVPALDVDSDNDGLSDYEEVNITGTDPLDQDTDNDTLMDSDELIATGGTTGATPRRTFDMESNPFDINTDDDHLFDPQEYDGSGLSQLSGATGGARDIACPYVNNDDSDNDSIQDGAVVLISPGGVIRADGSTFSYTHYEDFIDLDVADAAYPGVMRTVPTSGYGEQQDDALWDVCDPDSDGDGLNDGEEIALGTDPNDWDTDDDGRNDWHEVTGGGPIPTDPFDPDTDDDGLLDSAEVFGSNNTNPTNADTDGDGLCDGGTGTPWMTSGDARVVVNPICKSCSTPGLSDCGAGGARTGSVDGIGDHPNPHGYGEDKNGNGAWDGTIGQLWQSGASGTPETDPNQYDTDGDADGDGVEVLGFSTSRQSWIPTTDIFGRAITVTYPACGCLEPLVADTDGDQLDDGYEDRNHDGNFDFLPSEFDHQDPLPGPPIPYPTETNPCDPDTDHDDLTDYEERYQAQVFEFYANWDNDGDGLYNEDPVDGIDNDGDGLVDEDPVEPPFNPTNPLDHDTDNDRLYDGYEVKYECVAVTYSQLDNDGDALIDEDPVDGLDNDGDGLIDEDGPDFFVRFVPMLDPTNRDSDSDGFIDGLDSDPCNSELIPVLQPVEIQPIDTDGDGFADDDEIVAGTHPNDPEDYPTAYCMIDLDFDQEIDDRLWLEPTLCCGIANSVVIDIDSNVLIDARVRIIAPRDVKKGDFDGDGSEDDYRYVVEYAFGNYRVVQPRVILTIDDYDGDLTIDHAEVVRK